ncbi:hypothetical protein [Methylocucumis oryzae]|uniref:Uncharacterized protein n=1 Tax=Methylocucumis oryzae TaxID=1632867 RepID=A0A0F3II88_9GAMM|nr:hypothetical protein [Methylocucumis oryzae]KJV06461.1 hypothetical protein VZ94_11025 [Methylocucumis oryzae]
MFDKNPFLSAIQHAKSRDGECESPSERLLAYKLDDNDGIAVAVGFHGAMLSKVDYFLVSNHQVQLIELTDLKDVLLSCQQTIANELEVLRKSNVKTVSARKDIIKSVYKEPTYEFCKKWSGSIAVLERMYRKAHEQADPSYSLLIVCKNHTDVIMLDTLKNLLVGMMGNIAVCNTQNLKECLSQIHI